MMAEVKAPFRFAPVPRAVFFPAWADRVSHDVPFADGLSGEIAFSVEAVTPLLVGGPRRKATDERAGEVWPVRLPDGRYALPGSALQGMVRSLLDVASFANLAPFVRDRRYAVRDISGRPTGQLLYGNRLTKKNGPLVSPLTRAGWLVRRGAGDADLIPCEHARIGIDLLARVARQAGRPDPRQMLQQRREAPARYAAFLGVAEDEILARREALDLTLPIGPSEDHPHQNGSIQIRYRLAGEGAPTACTLVLTGKPQAGTGRGHKKLDFAFFAPDRRQALDSRHPRRAVPEEVWRDFLLIHDPPVDSGQKVNPNWALWKPAFDRGELVPVFWLPDGKGGIAALGTAFMFKLAMPLSSHDLLRNSSADHRPDAPPDLPSLIFGSVAGREGAGLKRRASFDWAVATLPDGAKLYRGEHEAVLLAPKPGFYPFYIRQPKSPNDRIPQGQTWAVYMAHKNGGLERERPESAGVKIWPAHVQGVRIPAPPPEIGKKVRNRLNALPRGTRFESCRLRFHNLRPAELGALLWALTFGDLSGAEGFLHRLGMGKPLGLGMIRIRPTSARLLPNGDLPESAWSLEGLLAAFTGEMDRFHRAKRGGKWQESPQVKALLKAADPSENAGLDLSYVGTPEAHSQLRSDGRMLSPYVDGVGEIPRAGPGAAGAQPPPGGPAPPPPGRIVTAGSPPNLSRLRLLEDEHDSGRDFSAMLANLLNQARNWPDADRRVFAALCHGKLRAKVNSQLRQRIENMFPASD